MTSRTRQMTLSAVFMALGVLVPFLFHTAGLGPMFLPMFWPLAAAGVFLEFPFAVTAGFLTPVLSTMVTGMPPPPVLYKMMVELAILTGIVSVLIRRTRWGLFWIIALGLVGSRTAAWIVALGLAPILGLPPRLYAFAAIVQGIPGMAAMMVILPLVLTRLTGDPVFRRRSDVPRS